MPTDTPSTAVATVEPREIERVREALEDRFEKIVELLPPTMDARRFLSVSLMALTKNPGLMECDRASIVLAILEAAEVGLEPTGGIGGAHLVPFNSKTGKHAQLIFDYRGIQYLIREGGGGEVKTVLVYEGDIFRVYEGTERARIVHTKKFQTDDPTKILYVYAVPLDNPSKFEVMTKAQIDGIRARSKAANNGPWVSDYGAMARKTILKRISAWLPLKSKERAAIDRDTQAELADEGPAEPVVSRTQQVRERIQARAAGSSSQPQPQGAPEAPPAADTSAPDESAGQQTRDVVDGVVTEICGDRLVPIEGAVQTCELPPGHDGQHAKGSARWKA